MDASNPLPLLKALLPKVPLISKTAIQHTLGLSEHSKKWDLRTELTVTILRSFIIDSPREPISKSQHMSLKAPPPKGRMWVSKVTLPPPETSNLRESLFSAIESMKDAGEAQDRYTEPELLPVEAEWVGYRKDATKHSPELQIGEEEKFKQLMKDVSSPTTILYFHGGAYYLLDPATYRPTAKKLAKLTKGRVLNVRYRLAPQNPFPAALLDALTAYLSLLYPAPGAVHTAVEAKHIVFAGDSAGGNLCLVLLQTLLQFQRLGTRICWHGVERVIPLPAGIAMSSPWADITHSLPSCAANGSYDYLPPLVSAAALSTVPPCAIWPSTPPRNNLFAEDSMLAHPLVSPLAARSWAGSCPIYLQTGTELLTDEDRHIAQVAAGHGVSVVYEEYEALPHVFAMLLVGTPAARRFFDGWTGFMTDVTVGEGVKTKGVLLRALTLKEEEVDLAKVSGFTDEEVRARMKAAVSKSSGNGAALSAKL